MAISRKVFTGETMAYMSVGDLAESVGVNVQTLRFYEREGLLPEPERTSGGHRLYSEPDAARLRFIQGAKECGFTLKEIQELLFLRSSRDATCAEVSDVARRKLVEVNRKLDQLITLKAHLQKLIRECPGVAKTVDCCNILRDFEQQSARKNSRAKSARKTR